MPIFFYIFAMVMWHEFSTQVYPSLPIKGD